MDEDVALAKRKKRNYARQLCGEMHVTRNYGSLLPKVIKLMADSDIGVKRISYSAYAKHSHKVPSEALLAINTILQDSCHPSPLVRALVLNTVHYMRSEGVTGILHRLVSDGLKDTSAFVRRHAVVAQYYCNLIKAGCDNLEVLTYDPDPVVSTLSLLTCPVDAGREETTLQLLNRLQSYTTEGVVQVISSLRSFSPASEEQLLDIINVIDSLLDSEHLEIVTVVMDTFLLYSRQVADSLARDMHTRIFKCTLRFLRSSNVGTVYGMMLWIQECLQDYPRQGITSVESPQPGKGTTTLNYQILQDNYHLFLDKSSDPAYLLLIKLDILSEFLSEENANIVADNVKSILQTRYKVTPVCDRAIQFAIDSRKIYPDIFKKVLDDIIHLNQSEIQICLLKHLHSITTYDKPDCEHLYRAVLPRWSLLSHSELTILLSFSAIFAAKEPENVEHLRSIADYAVSSGSQCPQEVKVALLHAVTVCVQLQPAEYMACVRQCLSALDKDTDIVIREQVKWSVLNIQKFISAAEL